ncbi:M56 family metallopeptidase [Pseudarthrobacter sp. J1738]|uniref:M56 family metallopeptidase n=1 Tax=unclassified Pseudarthrobacter TaxID=2647000 RepID=UPI003D2B7621
MFWTSWILAVLAIALAWPVPIVLSHAKWPSRSPFAAMVLWQAIALAGGLSMIGAMLAYGLDPLGPTFLAGLHALANVALNNRSADDVGIWHLFALSAAALLLTHLLFTLLLTYVRIVSRRRRHRELLALLSSPGASTARTLVINHPAPVAYCLPGGARSVTVLSDGLLELLSENELQAVLEHEKTHLSQRHDLLLWAFAAWKFALPWLPTSRLAQQSVNVLIEMLADDAALKRVQPPVLVRAIAMVSSGSSRVAPSDHGKRPPLSLPTPSELNQLVAGSNNGEEASVTLSRIQRLIQPLGPLSALARRTVICAAVLLLAAPTALILVPGLVG